MKITNKYSRNKNDNKLYGIYCSMIDRCYNKKCRSYKNYGARGIEVCTEWLESFNCFVDWAYDNGYIEQKNVKRADRLSIDRIDNDKNYTSDNCQWITLSENVLKAVNGRKLSDKTKEKISKSHKGIKLSDTHKEHLSNSHIGKNLNNKNASKGYYVMMDKNTYKILKIFDGNKELQDYFKTKSIADINLCAKGKRSTARGFKWNFIERNDEVLKSQIV